MLHNAGLVQIVPNKVRLMSNCLMGSPSLGCTIGEKGQERLVRMLLNFHGARFAEALSQMGALEPAAWAL
jgi:hypothetical protein